MVIPMAMADTNPMAVIDWLSTGLQCLGAGRLLHKIKFPVFGTDRAGWDGWFQQSS